MLLQNEMKNSTFDIRSIYANDMTPEFIDSIVQSIMPKSLIKMEIK